MSGLLAGQYFRCERPIILEQQKSLPNNHKALLRFRTDRVQNLTGIPFRKVIVTKGISEGDYIVSTPSIKHNNLYSQKVSGEYANKSIMNIGICERYIAPDNFIHMLSAGLSISYGVNAEVEVKRQMHDSTHPMISTMPVSILADMLDYDIGVELHKKRILTYTFDISHCDVYQTIYYPERPSPLYRLSITGSKGIAELCEDPYKFHDWGDYTDERIKTRLIKDFGISTPLSEMEVSYMEYGKLIPCKGPEVKEFISWATREHNIYSLGRWGTYRQILMDDVVKDLHEIVNLINRRKGN